MNPPYITAEPPWLIVARRYLGTREIKGSLHNSTIIRWWRAIKSTIRDDETPWCAAFVGGVLEECGYRSSRNPAARSYMTWGARLDYPSVGCIVVFSRPPSPWSGHVGFLVGKDYMDDLVVLGGNQGDRVSIATFPRERLLGYRWPMPVTDETMPLTFASVPRIDDIDHSEGEA